MFMETVLVTGGTGFIGLHCLQQLLDKGYKVRTTIRSESRKQEVLEAMNKRDSKGRRLYDVDTEYQRKFAELMNNSDVFG